MELTPKLYTNSIINSLAKSLYSIADNKTAATVFDVLGIDISKDAIAKSLKKEYPAVSKSIASASSLSKLNTSSLDWKVKDKDSFVKAFVDRDNVVNQDKMKFSAKADSNDYDELTTYGIIAEFNGKETEIFNTAYYDYKSYNGIQIYSYIDNALYFLVGSSLYRMELSYDETGEIVDSEVSLVKKGGYCRPVKAMKNKLILSFFEGKYTELNTVTGEFSGVDYNEPVNGENLDLAVSSQQACKIAFNALKDKNNYETESFEASVGDFSEYEIVRETGVSPQLYYNPDLLDEHVIHEYFPEYAWKIQFKGNYIADVYVNAKTGDVCSVSFNFLD